MEKRHPAPDDSNFIDRPDAERMVEKVPPTNYDIIVGNHVTGKSTLVYHLARRLPGVVYDSIPPANVSTQRTSGVWS